MDPRNALVFEMARLIYEMKPVTICMENVPEIAKMDTPEGVRVLDVFAYIIEKGVDAAEAILRLAHGAEAKPVFVDSHAQPRVKKRKSKPKAKAAPEDQGALF